MIESHYGEFAALLTAVFWTITAVAFESATIKVGTYAVNIIRLFFGLIFLSITVWFIRGIILPIDASLHAWFWLSLSGIVGVVVGDLFLFASYPIISSRISMLIMTLNPPMAAIMSWAILGEKMELKAILGMCLVITGISFAILNRQNGEKRLQLKYSLRGIIYAFIGSFGQASGLVLSKLGIGKYNPFAATQIRLIAGIIGFIILISVLKKWKNVTATFKNKPALKVITIGSFFGPFLGISFSLIAIQNTGTGVASTLMSIVPVLIILPAIIILKQKVSLKEIIGSFISIIGVSLFFIPMTDIKFTIDFLKNLL
jgi:drug/metabolite transporter (DMT)-like permease